MRATLKVQIDGKIEGNCADMLFSFTLEFRLSKTSTFDEPVRKKNESVFF
jgi:hypothetical protein